MVGATRRSHRSVRPSSSRSGPVGAGVGDGDQEDLVAATFAIQRGSKDATQG